MLVVKSDEFRGGGLKFLVLLRCVSSLQLMGFLLKGVFIAVRLRMMDQLKQQQLAYVTAAISSVSALTFGLSLLPICTEEALLTFSCTTDDLMNSDFIRFFDDSSVEIGDQ